MFPSENGSCVVMNLHQLYQNPPQWLERRNGTKKNLYLNLREISVVLLILTVPCLVYKSA
jgi:hypothetical protein